MLEIRNLTVNYGKKRVYDNFDFDIEEGKITCILGESGCGKTTLLNAVANLIPYGGTISPVKVSYVFQSPRLVPALTILKNLTLVGADEEKARGMLARVGLEDRERAYPSNLSGGEAQRVALCRAFLFPSELLLMDEPFSSLDLKTKLAAMQLFLCLQREEGRTALFVTHDIDEALYLADRVVVMDGGRISAEFENAEKVDFGASAPLREKIIKCLLKE